MNYSAFQVPLKLQMIRGQGVSSSTSLLIESLEEIKNNKFNNMKTGGSKTPGNKLVLLVKDIICSFKDDEDLLKGISKGVVLKLANILRSTNIKRSESIEKMWNKILIYLNDTSLTETFKPVLQKEIMESTTSSFVFSVAMMIVKKLYKRAPEINVNDKLSTNEREIIHYVSGCILFAFIKIYKRFDESGSIEAKDALLFFHR